MIQVLNEWPNVFIFLKEFCFTYNFQYKGVKEWIELFDNSIVNMNARLFPDHFLLLEAGAGLWGSHPHHSDSTIVGC